MKLVLRLSKGGNKMKLTKQEVIKGLEKMAEDNLARREAFGVEGENPEYVVLVNALVLLG